MSLRSIIFMAILAIAITAGTASLSLNQEAAEHAMPELRINTNDPDLIIEKSGQVYYRNQPFAGYLEEHWPNGNTKSIKAYFNGYLDGDYRTCYPNGQKSEVRSYRQGRKDGRHLGYFPDGQQKFEYCFRDGKAVGTHKHWYSDGSQFKIENYDDSGHPFGLQQVWRPDGKLRSNFVVKEDGRSYGLVGLKRCTKIDSETKNMDPYAGN